MKSTVLLLCCAAVSSAMSTFSYAQSERGENQDQWQFGLGVGAGSSQSIYRGVDNQTTAIPLLSARYNDFYFEGGEIGYTFYKADSMEFFAALSTDDGFDTERTDSDFLKDMGDVKEGTNVILGAETFSPIGLISVSVAKDVSSKHEGTKVDLGWAIPIEKGRFMLMPNINVSWVSADLVNHYFGVTSAQARADRAAYKADSAIVYSVGVNAEYQLSDSWTLMGGVEYAKYGSEISDSSIVKRDNNTNAFMGINYRF